MSLQAGASVSAVGGGVGDEERILVAGVQRPPNSNTARRHLCRPAAGTEGEKKMKARPGEVDGHRRASLPRRRRRSVSGEENDARVGVLVLFWLGSTPAVHFHRTAPNLPARNWAVGQDFGPVLLWATLPSSADFFFPLKNCTTISQKEKNYYVACTRTRSRNHVELEIVYIDALLDAR